MTSTPRPVTAANAPAPVGPYSPAVQAGNLLFVSGQLALDPASGELVQDTFAAEVRQALDNLTAIVRAGGSDLDRVVKVGIYLTDITLFNELNELYAEYFAKSRPARSTIEVAALPRGARVEFDAIAVC